METRRLGEKCLSKETVYRGRLIDVEHWRVSLPDGRTASRDVVIHSGAAAVVALDEHDRITLVSQYRCPIGRVTLELPAGKLEADESPLDCARRELEEETGLRAQSFDKLTDLLTTPAFCSETITIYLATGLSAHSGCPDEDEFLNVVQMPLSEAAAQVINGEIKDAKTVAGILLSLARQKQDPA